MPESTVDNSNTNNSAGTKKFPTTGLTGRKIIYDEDGKPCRACNTLLDFKYATGKLDRKSVAAATTTTTTRSVKSSKLNLIPGSRSYRSIPPPNKEEIGTSSWMLLHSIVSKFDEKEPTQIEKIEMKRFLELFGKIYPIKEHGRNMTQYIKSNPIDVTNRSTLGQWLSKYHNSVNVKLGKESFDTKFWEDRWVNGWD
ncbi:uncharacterized protein PWA37_004850 [Arxiozyma heterogenica]|uniref:uncharacterized protein n=1 Tax=Arxiozyma heterogenica TaxID=278026 RepID=UPI002F050836